MRRQDEIVSLYQGADAPFRRLLCDLAGDLTPAFDGHVVAELVREAMRDTEPALGALGLSARRTFEPVLAASTHLIAAPVAGTWSALHRAPGGPGAAMDAPPDEAELARQATLHRALLFALEPVRGALCKAAGESADPHHALILACLAEMPAPEAVDALAAGLTGAHAPAVAVALAIAGTAAGREAVLAAVSTGAPTAAVAALRHLTDPDEPAPAPGQGPSGTVPALASDAAHAVASGRRTSTVPAPGAPEARSAGARRTVSVGALGPRIDPRMAPALVTAAREPAVHVAAAAATALAGHPALVAEVAPVLLSRRDPWITAHLLVALARARTGLEHVLAVGRGSRVGLVRALAVRAAGAIGAPEALAFVREEALHGHGAAQALALELAARDPDAFDSSTLVELTNNAHWRVRLNAALALAARDPQAAFPPLMSLLSSELEIERAGGVFALAYLSGDSAERVLFHLAGDASARVRAAAVASLSRHPTPRAHHALLKLALGDDPALGRRALQALSWAAGEGAAAILSKLLEARGQGSDPEWRGQLYRTAGALAASLMLKPSGLAAGLESAAPAEVAGCLDGLMLVGIGPSESAAVPPAALADPRVRARAALRATLSGTLTAAGDLAVQFADGDANRPPVLDATLELLALAPWLGRTPRCAPLQTELARSLRDPRYQRFAARQLDLAQLRAALPIPGEADAEVSAIRVRELPAAAAALVDLPRPRLRPDTSTPGYYAPPPRRTAPWWRPVALAGAALAALIACAALWSRIRLASVTSVLAPPAPRASAMPVQLTVAGGPPLAEGGPLTAKAGQHLSVAGPYPGPKVELEDGTVHLGRARSRPDNRLGCDLAFRLDAGTLDVDARPGASDVEIDAAGQRLAGTAARFRVTVGPAGGHIAVRDGTVELGGPAARSVRAGDEATWGTPPEKP